MSELIPQAEAYIQFRLGELAARNEHHRFEEIATRIARKRISANILIATGPVSAGGDQQRDAESFMTRIPDELPHSAGFSASASTAPVVVACTVQGDRLKAKVLADLAGICAAGADPVSHVAYFSVSAISEGVTHELKRTARDTYGVTLDVFCGADLAMFLAEPDLVWVAQHYLDLPTALVPPPTGEPGPDWYVELVGSLRRNNGPAALTPATQAEVTRGLRFATYDQDANADLPEWLDFMGPFLGDLDDGADTETVFRACYEMAVARFRGTGVAAGVEDLVRRAIAYALTSSLTNVVDDAVALASYWGVMWSSGVGRAEASEIADALLALRTHVTDLLEDTDTRTYPVRTASLTGTLAFSYFVPDWAKAEQQRGRPEPVNVAAHAGVRLDEFEVDTSALADDDLVDVGRAMDTLAKLVVLLPHARVYSVSQLARVFTMFAPLVFVHTSYMEVRDGLDAAVARAEGEAVTAERCRDRSVAFLRAGQPLAAMLELHNAKVNWFNGDTLYGAVLTMRLIARQYAQLRLVYAAKMYACTAAVLAAAHGDADVKLQLPKALLEAADYGQEAGCWVDAAQLTELALLARAQYLPEPFDFDRYPDLDRHRTSASLELAAVRKFFPELEPLLAAADERTAWFTLLVELVEGAGAEYSMSEIEFQEAAAAQLAGPVFGDLGPARLIDFEALGVRWRFGFANNRKTVLAAEAFVAAFQVFLADVASYHPVLIRSTVNVHIATPTGTGSGFATIDIDDSKPDIAVLVTPPTDVANGSDREAFLTSACFSLLGAVHARPAADLQALMEPMFQAGLMHKLFVGRPYEEAADLLDDQHYARCGAATRPHSSSRFVPVGADALLASKRTGPGYNRDEALQAIRERYQVAGQTLSYTLPRLLADPGGRAAIVRLRDQGWLDWQILVVLVNAAWNWRLTAAGIDVRTMRPGDHAAQLARKPETAESPPIPVDVFSDAALAVHTFMQTVTVATRWGLRGRQEAPGEEAMRDLLTRRYHYADDDLAHRDLLDTANTSTPLGPLLVEDPAAE